VEKKLGFKPGNGGQALSWLLGKAVLEELRREAAVFYELTGLGRQWQERGSPEERIMELVRIKAAGGGATGLGLPDIAETLGLENRDVGSAFGTLSRLGVLGMDGEKKVVLTLPPERLREGRPASGEAAERFAAIRGLLDRAAAGGGLLAEAELSPGERAVMEGISKKRGAAGAAFRQLDREIRVFGFTPRREEIAAALGTAGLTGEEAGTLTPEMLEDGSWKGRTFRSYNVKVPPTRLVPGRTNPYA
jgi:phenylalanyl-tRNA synthetase alpha chain